MQRPQFKIGSLMVGAMIIAACSGASESVPDGADSSVAPASTGAPEGVNASQDDVDVETVATDPAPPATRYATGDATDLFDPEVVHTFDIGLDTEALAELDADPAAEDYVEGSLTFDGETLDRIGIRYKGSVGAFLGCTSGPNPFVPSGPKTCTKLSLKLKINWDGADAEFYGQRRVLLHAMNLDQSMMRDRLGYQMFRDAGVPSPRSTHARVEVNGEFVGLFALVEHIDGRFTRDRFDDGTGNLYKEVWPFDETGSVRASEELIDGLRTNEKDQPSAEIIQSFAQELLDADAANNPDAAREVLGSRTDLDEFMAYAVVDRAIRHDDGPFHWYCLDGQCEPHNFYFYEDPSSRAIHIIAWDLDNALSLENPITEIPDAWGDIRDDCEPFPFGPIGLLQRSAGCDPLVAAWSSLDTEYERVDAEFRAGPFSPENIRDLLDTWSKQIEPSVIEASAQGGGVPTVEQWRAAIDRLVDDFVVPAEQEN